MSHATILRDARLRAGFTQAELARRLGSTQAAVARLERPGANPTLSTLEEAVAATGHRLQLTAFPHRSSVDETLIARNLRLSPKERLAAFEIAHHEVAELRTAMRRSGGGS
jgi:transcriptional regulator with XRE-family HTH domain